MARAPRTSPPLQRTQALVLSRANSKDDLILRVLTEGGQLLSVVARWARRKSKHGSLASRLQPLSLVDLEYAIPQRGGLPYVKDAFTGLSFSELKASFLGMALASSMTEIILQLLPEAGSDPYYFDLLIRALLHLNEKKGEGDKRLYLLFLWRALSHEGILPPIDESHQLQDQSKAWVKAWEQGHFPTGNPDSANELSHFLEEALLAFSGRPLKSKEILLLALS